MKDDKTNEDFIALLKKNRGRLVNVKLIPLPPGKMRIPPQTNEAAKYWQEESEGDMPNNK